MTAPPAGTRYAPPQVPDDPLWDLWLSMYRLPTVAVADELHVIEALVDGASTAEDLAARLALEPRATRVLLDMLTALRLLALRGGAYELTAYARTYLLPSSAFYWGPLLRGLGVVRGLHTALLRALRSKPAAPASGTPSDSWAQGTMDVATAQVLSSVMHCHSLPAAIELASRGQLASVRRLLDVGGGSGCFSIALAQQHPHLRCTVMELSAVCEVANGYIAAGGVADRVDVCTVDMFREPWPTGYDGILLSNVLHDWDQGRNAGLVRSAFSALPPGGTIFLHEVLLEGEGHSDPVAAGFSMLMLLTTPGRQYTLDELRALLEGAGFEQVRAQAAHGRHSLITATRP